MVSLVFYYDVAAGCVLPSSSELKAVCKLRARVRACRPGGVVAVNVLGTSKAVQQAVQSLAPHFQNLHVLCTPELSIIFARAGTASEVGSRNAQTALWRVTATAQTIKPLAMLCAELLNEQLEQWAMNDPFHAMLKKEFGYGWFAAKEFLRQQQGVQ